MKLKHIFARSIYAQEKTYHVFSSALVCILDTSLTKQGTLDKLLELHLVSVLHLKYRNNTKTIPRGQKCSALEESQHFPRL